MSRLKCVARWRRKRVLFGGMFSSNAMVSTLNRGSSTWGERECLGGRICTEFPLKINNQLSHHQASVHTAASEVGSVLSKVHRPQPLHYSVVGPLGNLCWSDVVLWRQSAKEARIHHSFKTTSVCTFSCEYKMSISRTGSSNLIRWPTTQAVGLIAVESQHLYSSLDTEVMQDTSHLQRKQVILGDKVRHQWVTCWSCD